METLERYTSLPFIEPEEAGRNLERLIKDSGLSQVELAKLTLLKQSAISRAIATGRGIRPAGWRKLANALGVPVESIFGLQRLPDTARREEQE